MATGVLRFGAKQANNNALGASGVTPPNSLGATGQGGNNLLNATGAGGPPSLQASAKKKYMPDDILEWLKHLERIEKRKRKLVSEQIAAALVQLQYLLGAGATKDMLKGLIDEGNGGEEVKETPATDTQKSIGELNHDWDVLVADFNSFPPPKPCVPLRDEFDQHIREVRAQIGDILRVIESSSENPDASIEILRTIEKNSKKGVDEPGERSERLLEEIFAAYETKQWFTIDPDPGRGKGLLGSRGF
jgi:hypothetical protein